MIRNSGSRPWISSSCFEIKCGVELFHQSSGDLGVGLKFEFELPTLGSSQCFSFCFKTQNFQIFLFRENLKKCSRRKFEDDMEIIQKISGFARKFIEKWKKNRFWDVKCSKIFACGAQNGLFQSNFGLKPVQIDQNRPRRGRKNVGSNIFGSVKNK